ncbi:MAG: C47 family peptidase [Clostridia bacterium]|nr:C47 family peptidase [Clostridia bacterium]
MALEEERKIVMRKIFIRLISVLLSFVMFASAIPVFAETESPRLQFYTESCPSEAMEYAESSYVRMIRGAVELDSFDVSGNIYLGTPFVISTTTQGENDVYYFPLINNDSFIGTFRIYQDTDNDEESYSGIVSRYLSDELNFLNANYADSQPIFLYEDNYNIMAKIGNDTILLHPSEMGTSPIGVNVGTVRFAMKIVTPMVSNLPVVNVDSVGQTRSPSAGLSLSIIETQGNNNWCAAYATAIIIRYLTGNTKSPTAAGLMSIFYRNPTSSDTFPKEYVIKYAQSRGYNPITSNSSLGSTAVFAQIDALKPIYISAKGYNSSTRKYSYHALVLRGYSRTNDTYSIWNPWHNYYETMDMIKKTYKATSVLTYTWNSTIYNW